MLCAATACNAEILRTSQTTLVLAAGASAPQLVSLGLNGGENWVNGVGEALIDHVMIAGRSLPVHWTLDQSARRADDRNVTYVYTCPSPKLRLSWTWRAPASIGPLEHVIRIENLDTREIWLPLQDSFGFAFRIPSTAGLEHFFVEKGAGAPSDAGTHTNALPVSYVWTGTSSTYAHPAEGEPREIIPFLAVQRARGSREGWYAGIEFSGRTRLSLARDSEVIRGSVGLNPEAGSFRTRLQPHELFDTPAVFVGAFDGGVDSLGNVLRPWVRQVLANPRSWQDLDYPLLVNNSWGSGMQVDDALARRMILDSRELGLEMFHIDAGWFRGVGDWYPDPKKFPHGLAAVAEFAHQHRLKFGIWTDWTQAGLDNNPGALNLRNPAVLDWTVSDLPANWKPAPFKGQTIDLGVPAARAWAGREVLRIVEDYKLDMLEHDGYLVAQGCIRTNHPHAPPDPSLVKITRDQESYFVESANSTDVSYHAVRAYYDVYETLRKRHPDVLLEICNDGGRMVDFGSAAHGDYFSITDAYDPLSNRRAFYDASHLLPAPMLESYVQKWPTPRIENFRYMLRSGMMGWLTIMQDTNSWTPEQHAAAKREFELYRQQLRGFIRDADLYHVSARPDGVHWDALEYFDPRRNAGVVYAFRGSTENEGEHAFRLKGLIPNHLYRLRFRDGTAPARTETGRKLADSGVSVHLSSPLSSELVFIDAR
jgi:hypothetical protein